MSKKVLKHPDKEEIITALNDGTSVRELEAKLKEKYPGNKNLWLSSVTLQAFRKNYLKLDGKVLKDLQETGRVQKQQVEEQGRQQQLEKSDAYNKKLNEIVDTKLDVSRKILQLDKIIDSRLEYWYNVVSTGEESAAKGDKELRLFMDRQMALLAQYKKFVEGLADRTVDYNVNVTVINDQINLIRDVIRECITELRPEDGMILLERINTKVRGLTYRPNELAPPTVKLEDLQEAEVEPLETESQGNDNK